MTTAHESWFVGSPSLNDLVSHPDSVGSLLNTKPEYFFYDMYYFLSLSFSKATSSSVMVNKLILEPHIRVFSFYFVLSRLAKLIK